MGWKNVLDYVVIVKLDESIVLGWIKVGEILFNFDWCCLSVVVENNIEIKMIIKGVVEEMFIVCIYKEFGGIIFILIELEKSEF